MRANPALARIGLGPRDKAVILHADDVGMCHATIPAALELHATGMAMSFSVMVPCPWAELATRTLSAVGADLGVHWTITSEWPLYRWGPLTEAADLRDSYGRFPATNEEIRAQAAPGSVAVEPAAQLDQALRWAAVSHCDAHMGSIGTPRYLPAAIETALSRHVVPFLPRMDAAGWRALGLDGEAADQAAALIEQLDAVGLPMVDHIRSLPLEHADDHLGYLLSVLDELPPGLCHLYFHPAVDTPELRAIANDWQARVANLDALRSNGLQDAMSRRGVTLLSYGRLQTLLP